MILSEENFAQICHYIYAAGLTETDKLSKLSFFILSSSMSCLWAYADNEGPYQPEQQRSLIWGLHCPLTVSSNIIVCMNVQQRPRWYFLRIRRMIWICALCSCSKALFAWRGPPTCVYLDRAMTNQVVFFSGNCTNDYEVGEQRHCHTGVTMSLLSNFIIVHAKIWFLHVSLMS